MADEVDRWAAREAERRSAGLPTPFYFHQVTRIFKNLLAGITSPDEAAKRIESAVMDQGSDFWNAYEFVIARILSAAESLGDDLVLRRLAALVASLVYLPDAKNNGNKIVLWEGAREKGQAAPGETITCNGERLWADLPGLFDGLVYIWKSQESYTPSERKLSGLSDEEVRDRWANANAFCAYLAQLSAGHNGTLTYDILAIWTLRCALEEDDILGTGTPIEPDIHIPAAAYWIHILGSEMRYWTKVFHGTEKRMVKGGIFYDADKHGHGFSPARWNLWRERFRHFSQDSSLDPQTQRIASNAAEFMK